MTNPSTGKSFDDPEGVLHPSLVSSSQKSWLVVGGYLDQPITSEGRASESDARQRVFQSNQITCTRIT